MYLGNTYCVQDTLQDFINARRHSHCSSQKFTHKLKDEAYPFEGVIIWQ